MANFHLTPVRLIGAYRPACIIDVEMVSVLDQIVELNTKKNENFQHERIITSLQDVHTVQEDQEKKDIESRRYCVVLNVSPLTAILNGTYLLGKLFVFLNIFHIGQPLPSSNQTLLKIEACIQHADWENP